MRLFIFISLALVMSGCGEDTATQDSGPESRELATRNAQPVETSNRFADTAQETPDDASPNAKSDVGDDTTPGPVEELPCELSPGMCPNACEHGESEQGDICVTDSDCACGHCCGFGSCQPFDAMGCESFADYATCLCPGESPEADPIDPGGNETPWRVDPMDYVDDCDAATPNGSTCNPFCQLGCPPDSHCALVDDISFGCVSSGSGTLGDACEHPGECGPWWSCFGTFDAEFDTCRQVCDADEECPSGQACNLEIQLTSSLSVSFCDTAQISCDLWLPDCPGDMKCIAVGGKTICTEATWDGIEGYPCTELGDCAVSNEAGDRMLCMSVVGCAPICSTADSLPLGAKSCAEMCPGGYTSVDINLDIGRCSSAGP